MSSIDPVSALIQLLNSQIRVVKENEALAKVLVTEANFDRELLVQKDYDAQVTVQLDPFAGVVLEMLNLQGSLRRQVFSFKVAAYAVDKVSMPGADAGRVMRQKVTEQIRQVIHQNRKLVSGLAYCDVVSYKLIDLVDVKPFLFKVEFALRGWSFETGI
jgi:hypothetical protein